VTYWGTGDATFFRVEFFFRGGGCAFQIQHVIIKTSGYLNFIDAYNSSEPLLMGSLIGKFRLLQKLITHSFPEVAFSC
jgi:hypothetical protein